MEGFESILIDACLHNWVFDLQCEGGRAEWLAGLIAASGRGPELMARLIPEFDQPCAAKDARQRCGLAMLFAQRGAPGAREALYRCVRKLPDEGLVLGGGELVELDGAAGLKHYARASGKLILSSDYLPTWDWPLSYFDEKHGAGAGRKVLDDASKNSQAIRAFVQALDEQARRDAACKKQLPYLERVARLSVDGLLREAEGVKSFAGWGFLRVWGRKASEADLKTVFEVLAAESDPQRLRRLLMVFQARALAEFDARLLEFTQHDDRGVRELAYLALSNYQNDAVRKLTEECLAEGRLFENELKLLQRNWRVDDETRILAALRPGQSARATHSLVIDLLTLVEAKPFKGCLKAMFFIYEESPCSLCRTHVIEHLLRAGVAPEWLIEEVRHDGQEQIREKLSGTSLK
ncbi:MAG: hypothetical protein HY269_09765 [Deltaproteobacteria bacterium]|nr:hypothetical protein [Deltaproteobacteria bacterium]